MNRRLAIGRIIGLAGAASAVKASDFDPYICREDDSPQGVSEYGPGQTDSDAFWSLRHQMPDRISNGIYWITRVEGSNIMNYAENERPRLLCLFIPRGLYRWLVRTSYLRRMDACRPDLTDNEWAICNRVREAENLLNGRRQENPESILQSINQLVSKL